MTDKSAEAPKERVIREDPADEGGPEKSSKRRGLHRERLNDEDRLIAEGASRKKEARLLVNNNRQAKQIQAQRTQIKTLKQQLGEANGQIRDLQVELQKQAAK